MSADSPWSASQGSTPEAGLKIEADPPPLNEADDGVLRVSGTRVPLERVIRSFQAGSTPEQIVQDYDVLSLEDVYAVLNFYLHHRVQVDAYLVAAERESAENRRTIEKGVDLSAIRHRLLSRLPIRAR